jgi:lysozyme family protein
MNFDKAFELLIGHEGGYTTNPKDAGNWTGGKVGVGVNKGTKYGIAANSYPNLDIKNLSLDQAKAIYKRDYWDKVKGDQLPQSLAFHVFDMAVNSGVSRGIKLLQKTIGTNEDGLIGPKTLAAVNAMNVNHAIHIYNANRLQFYTSLRDFSVFGKGWVNRVANNLKLSAGG